MKRATGGEGVRYGIDPVGGATAVEAIADAPPGAVVVHCVGGKHRTGVMTAVYRMTNDGWSADQAFREMKQFNFGLDFLHSEFKKFVYGY